jgi:hypothetical protein
MAVTCMGYSACCIFMRPEVYTVVIKQYVDLGCNVVYLGK